MKDGVMGEKVLKRPMPVRCQSKGREAEDADGQDGGTVIPDPLAPAEGQAQGRISTSFACWK